MATGPMLSPTLLSALSREQFVGINALADQGVETPFGETTLSGTNVGREMQELLSPQQIESLDDQELRRMEDRLATLSRQIAIADFERPEPRNIVQKVGRALERALNPGIGREREIKALQLKTALQLRIAQQQANLVQQRVNLAQERRLTAGAEVDPAEEAAAVARAKEIGKKIGEIEGTLAQLERAGIPIEKEQRDQIIRRNLGQELRGIERQLIDTDRLIQISEDVADADIVEQAIGPLDAGQRQLVERVTTRARQERERKAKDTNMLDLLERMRRMATNLREQDKAIGIESAWTAPESSYMGRAAALFSRADPENTALYFRLAGQETQVSPDLEDILGGSEPRQ